MDWAELENILRSRATEPESNVVAALLRAIGRKMSYAELLYCIDRLWDGHYEGDNSKREADNAVA
jgi:hypothetical protein